MNEAVLLAALAVRSATIAVVAIVGLRLLGKRQLGQMNVYDVAMVMALANGVQNAMTRGSGHLLAGLVSAGTLLAISTLITMFVVRVPSLEGPLIGSPTLLAYDGRLVEPHLRRHGVTAEQVMAAVRERGLSDLADVLTATLEIDGSISVIPADAPARHHPDVFEP